MATLKDFKSSRFLTKEDCGPGILCTIDYVQKDNIAKEGMPPEQEQVVYFVEPIKPFILKLTNFQLISGFLQLPDTDDWQGKKIVLYNDPSVRMGHEMKGGIRARAPRGAAANAPAQARQALPPAAEAAQEQLGEDVPY